MPMTLFVPATKVATWLGLDPETLTNAQTEVIEDAILDAQSKVSEYLNRPLEPVSVTLDTISWDETWPQTDTRAWPEAGARLDDAFRVSSYVPSTVIPGAWDVTFLVGLDVEDDPDLEAIRRFIRQDAVVTCRLSPALPEIKRQVTSVSAEGQSVSYEKKPTNPDAAGGEMTLGALRRWRRYAVGRAQAPVDPRPWPYRA